jgi:hypothetical protein
VSDFEQPVFGDYDQFVTFADDRVIATYQLPVEPDPELPVAKPKSPYQQALSLANSVLPHPLDDDQATALAAVYAQLAIADRLERVETGILKSLASPLPGDTGDVEGGP